MERDYNGKSNFQKEEILLRESFELKKKIEKLKKTALLLEAGGLSVKKIKGKKRIEDLSTNGNGEYKDIVDKNTSITVSQGLENFGFDNVKDFYITDSGNRDNTYDIIFYNKICVELYIKLYTNEIL